MPQNIYINNTVYAKIINFLHLTSKNWAFYDNTNQIYGKFLEIRTLKTADMKKRRGRADVSCGNFSLGVVHLLRYIGWE